MNLGICTILNFDGVYILHTFNTHFKVTVNTKKLVWCISYLKNYSSRMNSRLIFFIKNDKNNSMFSKCISELSKDTCHHSNYYQNNSNGVPNANSYFITINFKEIGWKWHRHFAFAKFCLSYEPPWGKKSSYQTRLLWPS